MKAQVRILLSVMMFLQYAVWGSWTPVFAETIGKRLNATGAEVGTVYGVLWLACIITPFIGGQLVDRLMPSQIYLGISALVGAVAAWMMSQQEQIGGVILWMWVWAIAFAPTLGITNSIALHHLSAEGTSEEERERDFAVIRTAGTVGWIAAAWVLGAQLAGKPAVQQGEWRVFEEMQLTAYFGAALTALAFLLPNTPPARHARDPWAFTRAFGLFQKVPGFTAFMLISFVVSTEFQFFYTFSAPFLADLKVPDAMLSPTKSVSQIAEILALAVLLPISMKYLGLRKTLVIGVLAWPLRYFIFAIGQPFWLVVFSLTFHGIGFAFVFVTSQLYVDRIAPKDIRASAQSLLTLVTLGFGNWAGTIFSGWLKDRFTTFVPDPNRPGAEIPGDVNWSAIFMIPAVLCLLCAAGFWFTFREPADARSAALGEAELETVGA